jgi:hypothetical protein
MLEMVHPAGPTTVERRPTGSIRAFTILRPARTAGRAGRRLPDIYLNDYLPRCDTRSELVVVQRRAETLGASRMRSAPDLSAVDEP